jgi:hypothetical protein
VNSDGEFNNAGIKKRKKHNLKKNRFQELQTFGKSSAVIPFEFNPGIGIQANAQMWSHQVTGL